MNKQKKKEPTLIAVVLRPWTPRHLGRVSCAVVAVTSTWGSTLSLPKVLFALAIALPILAIGTLPRACGILVCSRSRPCAWRFSSLVHWRLLPRVLARCTWTGVTSVILVIRGKATCSWRTSCWGAGCRTCSRDHSCRSSISPTIIVVIWTGMSIGN